MLILEIHGEVRLIQFSYPVKLDESWERGSWDIFLLPLMNILDLAEVEHHKIINDLKQLMTN